MFNRNTCLICNVIIHCVDQFVKYLDNISNKLIKRDTYNNIVLVCVLALMNKTPTEIILILNSNSE